MSEEKKSSQKRQTKAGMLSKNSKTKASDETTATSAEKDTEDTPKISKNKAEERENDKPLH